MGGQEKTAAINIANKELVYQNEKKKKPADELAIAKKDLLIKKKKTLPI
ncbi:MAG: hypothetical protein ACJA1B_003116 [Polaribacter sp.]|jgi:hypothetical protein